MSTIEKFKYFCIKWPYSSICLGVLFLFSLMAFQGRVFFYQSDWWIYIGIAQNLQSGGVLYKDAVDTKNTLFLLFYYFFYYPYSLLFATTEFLYLWNALVLSAWYIGLALFVYKIVLFIYDKKTALFCVLCFELFLFSSRHSLFINQPQFALMFCFWLVYYVLSTYHTQSYRHYFVYGLILGLCFLAASPYIFLTLIVPSLAFLSYLKDRKFSLVIYRGLIAFLGFCLALGPFFFYFAVNNSLGNWWFMNFIFPTKVYTADIEFYWFSGLQILPLFFIFIPFLKKEASDKQIFYRCLWAFLGSLVFVLLFFLYFYLRYFAGTSLEINHESLGIIQEKSPVLSFFMQDQKLPFTQWYYKPFIVLLSLFAGNDFLVLRDISILYQYFLIDASLCAYALILYRYVKRTQSIEIKALEIPLLLIGFLCLLGRFSLSRALGSDSYNLYLAPMIILWLPMLINYYQKSAPLFIRIIKQGTYAAGVIALLFVPYRHFIAPEKLTDYSQEVKNIVHANPNKKVTALTLPWTYSYSVKWKQLFYSVYLLRYSEEKQDMRNSIGPFRFTAGESPYHDKIRTQRPEVILLNPDEWSGYGKMKPFIEDQSYQQVSFDSVWMFIRLDALESWKLS